MNDFDILRRYKSMRMDHNVTFQIIDDASGNVVFEHEGHNQATKSLLTGIAKYLNGGGILNQAKSLLSNYIPKYISLGTMGLYSQDEDENGLPIGIGISENEDEESNYLYYMRQVPGYGADGTTIGQNHGREYLGIGNPFDMRPSVSEINQTTTNCELINSDGFRTEISYRNITPEYKAEFPETIDVVYGAMIPFSDIAQYIESDKDYIYITEAGLWSTSVWKPNKNGLLAGYRIVPQNTTQYDMTIPENREHLKTRILKIRNGQSIQIIWKIQIGAIEATETEKQDLQWIIDGLEEVVSLEEIQQVPNLRSHELLFFKTKDNKFLNLSPYPIDPEHQGNLLLYKTTEYPDYWLGIDYTGKTEITQNVFSGNETLTDVILPPSLKTLGSNAFSGCTNLETAVLNDGLEVMNASCFSKCTNLKEVNIPTTVNDIGNNAFYNCASLESIEIPEGIEYLKQYVFYNCTSLTHVKLPSTLKRIAPDGNTNSYAFQYCKALEHIDIPDGVTYIGYSAFMGCISLKSIIIPDSVTLLGASAFYSCNSLETVKLSENLTTLNYSTFQFCGSLTDIEIPTSITSIGNNVFQNCGSLETLYLPDTITSIGEYAFSTTSKLSTIHLPAGITTIPKYAFYYSGIGSIEIPPNVETIDSYAFSNCQITDITFNEGLKKIDEGSFMRSYVKNVVLPKSLQYIGYRSFYECSLMESIYIDSNVYCIGPSTFYNIPRTCRITINKQQYTPSGYPWSTNLDQITWIG